MIYVVAKMYPKPEAIEIFLKLAEELTADSLKDAGCIEYGLRVNRNATGEYAFIEKWESMKDLEAHSATKHFTTIVPMLSEISTKEPQIDLYENI